MNIKVIDGLFSVCKVQDYHLVDFNQEYVFISKTDEENSLVCLTTSMPSNVIEKSDGWRGFRIQGILDFALVGILSKISTLLASHQISIFAISTFNTDYIFIKEENFHTALEILRNAGYEITEDTD